MKSSFLVNAGGVAVAMAGRLPAVMNIPSAPMVESVPVPVPVVESVTTTVIPPPVVQSVTTTVIPPPVVESVTRVVTNMVTSMVTSMVTATEAAAPETVTAAVAAPIAPKVASVSHNNINSGNFVIMNLAQPGNWVAGQRIFPSNVISNYNAAYHQYTKESWAQHMLQQCRSLAACGSTISYSALSDAIPQQRVWHGYVFSGGPTTQKDYQRSAADAVQDAVVYTLSQMSQGSQMD